MKPYFFCTLSKISQCARSYPAFFCCNQKSCPLDNGRAVPTMSEHNLRTSLAKVGTFDLETLWTQLFQLKHS